MGHHQSEAGSISMRVGIVNLVYNNIPRHYLTIRYAIQSYMCLKRCKVCWFNCLTNLFSIMQITRCVLFVLLRWVFSFLSYYHYSFVLVAWPFFVDQCSQCLLYFVFEYGLRSFVVYHTLWTYHLELIIIIIVIIMVLKWRCSGVSIINFEHISNLFLVFLLLTLNKKMLMGYFVLCEY